jgi:hypothetical protein
MVPHQEVFLGKDTKKLQKARIPEKHWILLIWAEGGCNY